MLPEMIKVPWYYFIINLRHLSIVLSSLYVWVITVHNMYTSFHMKGFPSHFTDHWPTSLSDDIPQLAFIISNSESKSSQYCNPIFTKTQEKYYSLTKSIRLAVLTNIRHQDQEINLLNKPISPRRLREGEQPYYKLSIKIIT